MDTTDKRWRETMLAICMRLRYDIQRTWSDRDAAELRRRLRGFQLVLLEWRKTR